MNFRQMKIMVISIALLSAVAVVAPASAPGVTIDLTALSTQGFCLSGVGCFPANSATLSLAPGQYNLQSGGNFVFTVTASGTVDFDPALDTFLTGRGTSTLLVRGLPVQLDATALSTKGFCMSWVGCRAENSATLTLVPGAYTFNVGGFFDFTVTTQGLVDYPAAFDTFLAGRGTSTLLVRGLAVQLDATALSTKGFCMPWVGCREENSVTLTLVPGAYTFESGPRFNFTVTTQGLVDYEAAFDAFLTGRGTSTLVIHGLQITVNATGLTTSTFALSRTGPLPTACVSTLRLLPGLYSFHSGGSFVFTLLQTGVLDFDPSLDGFVSGRGTNALTVGTPVSTQPCGNRSPMANAGPDQTVGEAAQVVLDGSGSSDPDGGLLAYQWAQLAGPSVSLSNSTSASPTFTAPLLPGGFGSQTLTFELTVSDGSLSTSDSVNVTVVNVNHAPVAEAGADQFVKEGSLVTLSGANSYDPDGDLIGYQWAQTSGPTVTLDGANTAMATFTAPLIPGGTSGTLALGFSLTVSDGGLSSTDGVQVTVEQVNHAPVAYAGSDQTRNEGSLVTLDGTGSADPDSDPLTYTWIQVSGPSVTLSDPNSPTPSFMAPTVGPGGTTLGFQLVVGDGLAQSLPDDVIVTVQNINDPPTCNLAQASPSRLWPPDHRLIAVGITGVTDRDKDRVTITITSVTQDEPVNGLGDGDTSPDAVIQGDKVLLRAERSGTGNGRVYRVQFTASDSQLTGGSCTGSVSVSVPHSMKQGMDPVDDGQLYDSSRS